MYLDLKGEAMLHVRPMHYMIGSLGVERNDITNTSPKLTPNHKPQKFSSHSYRQSLLCEFAPLASSYMLRRRTGRYHRLRHVTRLHALGLKYSPSCRAHYCNKLNFPCSLFVSTRASSLSCNRCSSRLLVLLASASSYHRRRHC